MVIHTIILVFCFLQCDQLLLSELVSVRSTSDHALHADGGWTSHVFSLGVRRLHVQIKQLFAR